MSESKTNEISKNQEWPKELNGTKIYDKEKPYYIDEFIKKVNELLSQYGFILMRDGWYLKEYSVTTATTYDLFFQNKNVTLIVSIQEHPRMFAYTNFCQNGQGDWHRCSELGHFEEIALPKLKNNRIYFKQNNENEIQYLEKYYMYLEENVNHEDLREILTGDSWFNFWFDFRDWATIPSYCEEVRNDFIEFKKKKNKENIELKILQDSVRS